MPQDRTVGVRLQPMVRTYSGEDLRLLERLDAGVVATDAAGNVAVWNAAAERILGLPSDAALGRDWSSIVTIARGRQVAPLEIEQAAAADGGWHGTVECAVVGGHTVRVRVQLQSIESPSLPGGHGSVALFWPAGAPARAVTTPRRLMRMPYRTLFQRSPEPLALTDREGMIVDINEAAASLFGMQRRELVGTAYRAALAGWTDADAARLGAALSESGHWSGDVTGVRGDGSTFPLHAAATFVSIGERGEALIRLRDVSHERHLERMLDELRDLARLTDEPRDVREVAQLALDIVLEATGAEDCVLLLAGAERVRAIASRDIDEQLLAAFGGIDPLHSPFARQLMEQPEPFEVRPSSGAPTAWTDRTAALGLHTIRGAPLRSRERQAGVVVLIWRTPPTRPFDAKELEHIGGLAGVAIANAELREEMRRETELRSSLEGTARIGGVVMAQMSDAIITTGRDRRITAVNPAAERHYGFSADDAIGRRLEDVIEWLRPDGRPLGREGIDDALSIGYWHGLVNHRPRVGSLAGSSVPLDVSLTAIRDERRVAVGLILLARELSASIRLESETATLSSLAIATGRARSRREVADAAIERLCEATMADVGAVVAFDERPGRVVEAYRGMSEATIELISRSESAELVAALEVPGAIVTIEQLAHFPSADAIVAGLARERIAVGLFVGLRTRDRTYGTLGIGSRDPAWSPPSKEIIVQAAAQVGSALEIARLMERLEGGLEQERRLTAQLETLIGLTKLPEADVSETALTQLLLERVIGALDGIGGFVVTPDDDGCFEVVASDRLPLPGRRGTKRTGGAFAGIEDRPRESFPFWQRLSAGSGPFYSPIDPTTVEEMTVASLRSAGFNSYAAFPIRDGDQLVAAFVCHFAQPAERGVPADERTLEAVGRIIGIAYANSRMREGLADAVEHERRLAAELRALQELTLLGAASDDLAELARATIDSVIMATGASGGGYLMLDEAAGTLDPVVWSGRGATTGPGIEAGAPLAAEWPPFLELASGLRICLTPPAYPDEYEGPRSKAQAVLPLHVDDRLVGVLHLEWLDEPRNEEFDVHFLEPIARIASISLANFGLRSELIQRAAAQRALSQRLDALDELTRIGEEASSFEELAHQTVNLVREALGADGACYLLIEPGHHFETHAVAGETGAFRLWLKGVPARDAPGGSILLSGGGSVLGRFTPGDVSERVLPLARSAGFHSFGAIPVRTGDDLAGALLCFFQQPAESLPVDESSLDSVARIAGIALANFRLRERLVSSEERYRTLFEESPDALFVSALDGTVLDSNEAAIRLYRVNRGEILGRYLGQLLSADERELARRRQIVWAQGRLTFPDRGRRSDGSEFPVEVEVRLVELGGQRRFLSLVRDLSDQERLQSELLQAQKMEALGQLVSGVAHELNNPLAAIIAFSQLLRRDPRLPDDMKHDAGLLVQEADRTRRIVQNLLDFARQRPPERRPTRIATLVQSVLELQSYALSTNRIQVALDMPETLPEVDLDRAQLQQVLLNLTINAIQAIKSDRRATGAHLWIDARLVDVPADEGTRADGRTDRGRVRITIRDDGPGVPAAARPRLFDPFFTTKQPGEGTGLGLSVSFGIVAAHGGQLWYQPGPSDVGSCFIIELPVRARSEEPRIPSQGLTPSPALRADSDTPSEAATPADAMAEPDTTAPEPPPLAQVYEIRPVEERLERPAPSSAASPGAPTYVLPGMSPWLAAAAAARLQPPPALEPAPPKPGERPAPPKPGERPAPPPSSPPAGATPAGSVAGIGSGAGTGAADDPRPQILVLDDEASIRAFLQRALAVAGMDCISMQDGAQALERVRDGSFDVMLIDHRMAGMSGTEFYEAAIRLRPELAKRAVFMSGDVLNPDLRGFATRRGVRLLPKPFDIDAVTRVVREALRTPPDASAAETGGPDD